MDTGESLVAKAVFRHHYAELVHAISAPKQVANELFSHELISEEDYQTAVSSSTGSTEFERATLLMNSVRAVVGFNHKQLLKFVKVVRRFHLLHSVARRIKTAYCESSIIKDIVDLLLVIS